VTFQANVLPIFWLALAAIPAVFMMTTTIPVRTPAPRAAKTKAPHAGISIRLRVMPFVILGVMVIIRGLAQPGSVNFIPALFQAKGWSPSEYGIITSLFWLASGIAGVIFGTLADKYDRRTITMVSMVLSAPAFFLLPATDGVIALLLAVAAGGLSGGSHSLLIVLAQEMLPAGKGFASGSMLGFIFASGAIGSLIIGKVADSIGLTTTFQLVAIAAAVSGVFSLLLPKQNTPDEVSP
jgi:FSR family fosmidomycin resistance protein-like MFS transporter